MKRVLIALENSNLVDKLKKTGKYLVHDKDITYQEGVLEYVSKYSTDIIITKDTLQGSMTKEIFLKQIKLIAPKIKVILFTNEITENYKGFLFANDIFNIIESDTANFTEILDLIESKEGQVIYKNRQNNEKVSNSVKVITKKIVAVFGTSGAGKSYFSSILSYIVSKKIKLNTLLIDMDTQNSAIDIYNNVNNYSTSLLQVMEDIDNDDFNSNSLYDSMTRAKKNSKLSFLLNNIGIYEAQNKLTTEYYSKIYNEAGSKFDVTIVDLPASPFLDVVPYTLTLASDVFFVINPNFISVRQAIKFLDLMVNVWGVSKQNIHIVINKKTQESLELKQVETLLRNYKVCLEICDLDSVEEVVNGIKELDLPESLGISELTKIFGADSKPEKQIVKSNVYNKINSFLGVNR
ncbi:MAG: DUF87 domain-containing protein [Clostridia bacterium]|nr:DUF87 domain-containing protein [Clostridia bacterium]